ncbi:MAG: AAA family ATPase [Pseudomonadota bacterium]
MNFMRGYPDEVYAMRADGRAPLDEGAAGFDVRAVIGLLWRARVAMVVGTMVGLLFALSYVATLEPTYTATAKVLFAPDYRRILDDKNLVEPASDALQNQIEILRSNHLMSRVVERAELTKLPQFNPAIRPAIGWGNTASAGPPKNTMAGFSGSLFSWLGLSSKNPEAAAAGAKAAREASTLAARRVLSDMVRLDPVPNSRVIAISASTRKPSLSVTVVNAVAQEYITAQLDAKLDATRRAGRWLTARVSELKDDVARAEANASSYRARLAGAGGDSVSQIEAELAVLKSSIAAASAERSGAQVRYKTVRDAIDAPNRVEAASDLEKSDVIAGARRRAQENAVERASRAAMVAPGHTMLAQMDARAAAVRDEIAAEEERIARGLYNDLLVRTAHENRLRSEARKLEEKLGEQDQSEARLREYERDAEASRLIYETFLSRLKETTQEETLHEADAVIISEAEPPHSADSASGRRIATFGALMGLIGGFGFAMVVERLNNTFRALEDVEDTTGLTVLGTIPLMEQSDEYATLMDYVLARPNSALAEAVRSLRTSLLFSHIDKPPQVVMFTSSVPGEGKSTTSLLLAVTSAQMGKSTVIVDCDLRRPTLSGLLGEAAQAHGGLRSVLDGSLPLQEACLIDPETSLTILPTRAEPGAVINAADALASERFKALLAELRERFELVILDAPPTLSVTDARLVTQHADASFYCIKWDSTPRETVLEGLRELSIVRPNLAGAVVTMVDMNRAKRDGMFGDYRAHHDNPYTAD